MLCFRCHMFYVVYVRYVDFQFILIVKAKGVKSCNCGWYQVNSFSPYQNYRETVEKSLSRVRWDVPKIYQSSNSIKFTITIIEDKILLLNTEQEKDRTNFLDKEVCNIGAQLKWNWFYSISISLSLHWPQSWILEVFT